MTDANHAFATIESKFTTLTQIIIIKRMVSRQTKSSVSNPDGDWRRSFSAKGSINQQNKSLGYKYSVWVYLLCAGAITGTIFGVPVCYSGTLKIKTSSLHKGHSAKSRGNRAGDGFAFLIEFCPSRAKQVCTRSDCSKELAFHCTAPPTD